MSRFFVDKSAVNEIEEIIKLTGDDVNHLKNVLRSRVGDSLIVCDGTGYEYQGVISVIEKNAIQVKIEEKHFSRTEPKTEVCLFQGIPKGDRMEQLIQKSVELGVSRIVPVMCKRTVVKFSGAKDIESKLKRWRRVSEEAAKQCNRSIIPAIEEPVDFKAAIGMAKNFKIKFIPYEEEKNNSLKDFIKGIVEPADTAFFIGPEGGFDIEEVELAISNGLNSVSLGSRILRTETAGPTVTGILRYEYGD